MPNLKFYKSATEPTDSGWETIANKNTIEHILLEIRNTPAKAIEGIKLDPIENAVQLPENPYIVTQEKNSEIYNFSTFLYNVYQASSSGKLGYSMNFLQWKSPFIKILHQQLLAMVQNFWMIKGIIAPITTSWTEWS